MNTEGTGRTARCVVSILYLGMCGLLLAGATQSSPLTGLLVVAAVFLISFITLLLLAVRWAAAEGDGRPLQFRISSLLLVMMLLGVYLAVVRWVVAASGALEGPFRWSHVAAVIAYSLFGLMLSLPAWLFLGEALTAWAAKAVRRPWAQRLIRLLYRRRSPTAR